jgi:3-oxoacyl-[acyl-carrier protein] reductase
MAMTNALAKTYAPHVRFNCVAPGWIRTSWGQAADDQWTEWVAGQSLQRRWGEAEDVAAVVGFLASPAASYCNGQCWAVNGGLDGMDARLRNRLI